MKKLEIVIKPEQLEELKKLLIDQNVQGMMVSNVMGFGNQKGFKKSYRGTSYIANFLPKIKVETIATDDVADNLIKQITAEFTTDDIGGGKIFVYPVEDVIRIRTGESGECAI